MKRTMAILAVFSAALILATPAFAGHIPLPTLSVTGTHLGGGLVRYELFANNPAGGGIAVEIKALSLTGNPFRQVDALVPVFAGGSGVLGPIDSFQLAQAADFFDANYSAANEDGLNTESYWDVSRSLPRICLTLSRILVETGHAQIA